MEICLQLEPTQDGPHGATSLVGSRGCGPLSAALPEDRPGCLARAVAHLPTWWHLNMYSTARIRGSMHRYIGERAVAVGVDEALSNDDAVVSTYCEHGHVFARGVPAEAITAETFGKATGCSRGRGGFMHLFDAARRCYGGDAIVGGGLPLAAGLALADRMTGRNRVTRCFFGDGPGPGPSPGPDRPRSACRRVRMVSWAVDGMDGFAVEDAARRAAEGVRAGSGPHFLEMRTYRFRAHSMYESPSRICQGTSPVRWRRSCHDHDPYPPPSGPPRPPARRRPWGTGRTPRCGGLPISAASDLGKTGEKACHCVWR